jgi:hypothetical protein
MVRVENFVEEQAVRKMFGPNLWKQLCDEIEREAPNLNVAQVGKILFQRTERSLKAKDTDTANVLQLQYEDAGPGIHFTVGRERGTITFRVNATPEPSLTMMLHSQPFQPGDLMVEFMQRLVG